MNGLAVIFGLFLWALATAVVYLVATPLFEAGTLVLAGLFVASVPIVWGILQGFWRATQTFPEDRLRTGVLIATPGLVLDALVMLIQPVVLPEFSEPGARFYASWLFWIYGLTCILSFRASRTGSGSA